jgi:hypothetical protein
MFPVSMSADAIIFCYVILPTVPILLLNPITILTLFRRQKTANIFHRDSRHDLILEASLNRLREMTDAGLHSITEDGRQCYYQHVRTTEEAS